jgi:hypothetical protein
MPALSDDFLLEVAPNIVIRVGSPPPFTSEPFALPPNIPQYIFSIVDIASRKTHEIGNDRTNELIALAKSNNPPSDFLTKLYYNSGNLVTATTTTTTAAPSPPPPPSPLSPPTPNARDVVEELPDNITFDEINYSPRDLVGVNPPATVDPRLPARWTALESSVYKSFKDFPSSVYIPAISSCINTPYFSPQAFRHRNGCMNDARVVDRAHTTYLWQCDLKIQNPGEDLVPVISPRPDGAINVMTQHRQNTVIWPTVYLDPGKWERRAGIKNGDSINAFSLILGIVPGGGDAQSQAAAWNIKISFGDVVFELFEGRPEATVTIKNKPNIMPVRVMVKPSSGSILTHGFGERPYIITFIPVWNGLLISDGIPGSSNWADSVNFIPVDPNQDINQSINERVNPPAKAIPYSRRDGRRRRQPDPQERPKLPPMVEIKRKGKRYKAPGVRVKESMIMDVGRRLSVNFSHCGASMKFVPIYFARYSRYHLVYPGAVDPKDIKEVSTGGTKNKTKPVAVDQNVFKVKTKSKAVLMPIFYFPSTNDIDFRVNLATIYPHKSQPKSCLSMEFKNVEGDLRRPIQVWGAMVLDRVIINEGGIISAPQNSDGMLTIDSVPEPRIRSFSINRSLDGSSGDIVWDRFNPITGVVEDRPFQRVGGIQVGIQGGANTIPGVLFTGIAYGNSQEDHPGDNLSRIPLRGRESKLAAEGGIVLVNAPFFDGYDHRDAMSYLANYGGVPIDATFAEPFRLISSYNINNPILDFPMGTAVSQAMDSISQQAGALYYFDRFGTLIYIDSERSTGRNWDYPDLILEDFSDEPDFTWVRNQIIIYAIVATPKAGRVINVDFTNVPTQVVMVRVPLKTYPTFPWAKMGVYTIPQIVRDTNELTRLAIQIARGQSRPRATARCKLPGNANIELLDTINNKWIVTSINHSGDSQRKTWSMELGVELFVPADVAIGQPQVLPLTDLT